MTKEPYSVFSERLALFENSDDLEYLLKSNFGLEKESLRVSTKGGISTAPHPKALGSALTHSCITTDYSEAMLELITPPMQSITGTLHFLEKLHTHVYNRIDNESLWATSMPCILKGESEIPIAQYGDSNIGQMKSTYRVGLGYRYGKTMQVISGVHYNFSMLENFWGKYQRLLNNTEETNQFKDTHYMGMVRNIQRFGWLIPYLFGSSPAVCKSFFGDIKPDFSIFDESTYYEPQGTSLRMGDIGYQNRKEEGAGVDICYNDLDDYTNSLNKAINTSAPLWEKIGVKVDGEYRQLNSNILQIENEYYSSVRPKQLLDGLEKPSEALSKKGIAYVELRSLDVNAFDPIGISKQQMLFLHAFMLFCLLNESQPFDKKERAMVSDNIESVAHDGRRADLLLSRKDKEISLKEWAQEMLLAMKPLAILLDKHTEELGYEEALISQMNKVDDATLTPSGEMLEIMRSNGEGFYQLANRLSKQHHKYFSKLEIDDAFSNEMDALAIESLKRQKTIEDSDQIGFDVFLSDYLKA